MTQADYTRAVMVATPAIDQVLRELGFGVLVATLPTMAMAGSVVAALTKAGWTPPPPVSGDVQHQHT